MPAQERSAWPRVVAYGLAGLVLVAAGMILAFAPFALDLGSSGTYAAVLAWGTVVIGVAFVLRALAFLRKGLAERKP